MAANEKVGIEIELIGGEEALALLKRIDGSIDTLNKKKKFKSLSGLNSSKRELEGYIKELEELEEKAGKARKALESWGDPFKKSAAGKHLSEELEKAEQRAEEVRGEIRKMSSDMDSVTRKTRTFKQEMNSISSTVAHIGSAMQSLGNSLVRLTSPFRRITTGLLMGAGYKALNMFTEGMGGAFERYDVMKNYSRTLEAFGFSAEEAQASVEKLNESVLGLPTGLDEIVAAQKVYVGATNDLNKATDIAIAANNTFLASGMGSREQRFMQKYLVALGSGAELAASQWDSMARIAPMAMRAVAKELNYADEDYQQFTKDVKDGTIAGEDFLDAFIKVGSSGKIADAANVMKMSFEGLSANIQNAAKRMGEGIIKSLDEVFQGYNGRTLLQTLLGVDAEGHDMGDGIKHWIDDLSASIQNWIKSHPEEITEFFETLRSIDWKGLLKGVGEGAIEVLDLFKRFAEWASDKDLSKVGKFAVWANVIGNALLVLGGALKGTRHIWGFIGALGKFGSQGLLGKLFSGIFGKGIATGGAMTVGAGINKGTFLGVGKIGLLAAEITGIVGALTTIVSAFAAVDMKLLSSAFKSFKEITENLNSGMENLAKVKATEIDMDAVKDIIKKISEVHKTLESAGLSKWKTGKFSKATENIRDTVWHMRRVAYQINQAASTTVDVGGFQAFIEQIRQAVESLKDLNQTMELDIKIVIGAGFKSSVDGVVQKIKGAKKMIQDAVDYVTKHTYKGTVSVTISASVNTAGAISKIQSGAREVARIGNNIPQYSAMGGAVYRAKGGGIGFPGRARSTDTVPTWLTPGEFVHNRRAVSTFGIDFMRKVNNLDMKGAMNELMHRAGSMANINRGTTITNNNYNNQRVVINNNGASGAGFTFKSASRFVGAF